MPNKGLYRNLDYIRAGLEDFVMDDFRITSHAIKRLRERGGNLEDLRRRPVLKGKTVVTYLPTIKKPQSVSGELWSSTRNGEIAPKSQLLFSDTCVVDAACCARQVRLVCSLIRLKYNVNIYVTQSGQVLISGSGDTEGAVQTVKAIVKNTLDNAAVLAAAQSKKRLKKTNKKKRTSAAAAAAAAASTAIEITASNATEASISMEAAISS